MKIITQQTHIIHDNGEIIEYFGRRIAEMKSELTETATGEWSCQFGFQYDTEGLSVVLQGEIYMTEGEVRDNYSIIGVDLRAYTESVELERFTINGLDEKGFVSELEFYL